MGAKSIIAQARAQQREFARYFLVHGYGRPQIDNVNSSQHLDKLIERYDNLVDAIKREVARNKPLFKAKKNPRKSPRRRK